MLDREIFTYLKKLEIANSSQNVQNFRFLNGTIHNVTVDEAISSNPLIVWNNPFWVDDPFTEKAIAWFAQAENWKLSQSQILSKDGDTLLKISERFF